ncbi:phosphonate ABC transporter ATP-binding protein [Herbaspirillum robiniae]|uniref:Phosphonate ABC transporter ATP-binding protein n=1 Tax=Herbaspirillum robiniae TaxID=2014887 RepID=A0ABX2M567_9BURK|nr:phosphonate ABC transporter ATP-binding protein [Herbaspirillum robiniae]NUU04495.1 phosphonate ABC transporter ATP-binding protein [Herbaspirillum robiniae]
MSHAIEIQGLVKEYKPGHPILKGIDLKIGDAGLVAIIGPSGTGKSTLIRCINRLVDPSRGAIWFESEGRRVNLAELRGRALRESRRHIGMVFQEYNLVERLSVMENLLCGRLGYVNAWTAWRRNFAKEDIAHAFELLETVGLGNFANQRADALSGGQRQRVGIARALMQRPRLLLADEPTSSLDPKTSFEIISLLKEQGRVQKIPVIVNIHDVELAKRYADRIIGMSGGHVVYDGNAENLSDDFLKQIYGGEDWLA